MPNRSKQHIGPAPDTTEPDEPVLDPTPALRGPVLIDGALAPVFRVPDPEPGAA